ncbi:MAG: DUF2271 domain-containing protein [Prevotella sp.]|jgi:hypothetical protein|nr:hypothetical protein [Prevotella sp.]MCH4242310.1 DUF2271 domain-containing protein [Prevotella sp.]MCI1686168.1 DUF2271 domain-containing protein [Prevotella sp.]MCI1802904.1 DUF2271 domain-containing protein [Prevotella sp.]MCI1816511.1 DUF2271 domain-containing protein [Prevotella sp.]MCI2179910.1 DUF2271 domain-containing protein [Prevotella sp.]
MKKMSLKLSCMILTIILCSCNKKLIEYKSGDVEVHIEQGSEWLHDYPLFLGIKKKNPPQIAIWIEDMQGHYLSTIYVTHKIATQSWQMANGNRRKSALPDWCYSRGVKYEDGLYLPTKKHPFVDGISGATPRGSFSVKLSPTASLRQFVVKIELNHSTDFNESYPKSAKPGDANYSGGEGGSGQPAVVYAADIDLSSGKTTYDATLIGHSSPDGSSGKIYSDVSGLTTALHIVKRITISIR